MNATEPFDRSTEDVGNIIRLEHVNVSIPDQRIATIFYISGLGLTRDPYLMTGITNMWVNVGASQFHLPLGQPQRLRGHIGLGVPNRASLLDRLSSVRDLLSGTRFGFEEHPDHVATTCPWGNAIRCYEGHSSNAGGMTLGLRYVEFSVPTGCAESIVDFYDGIFSAPGRIESTADGVALARVCVGIGQELVFRETSQPIPPYDGHHIQVYVHNFSQPHRRLLERGLVSEESDQHQFRFSSLVNLANGEECFKIEHEIRSMRHPLYARPLVNRNPDQSNRDYTPGKDALGA